MPTYYVEAVEKFYVRTYYTVEAESPEKAEKLCKSGNVPYNNKEIEDGDEEWVETVSIEEAEPTPKVKDN